MGWRMFLACCAVAVPQRQLDGPISTPTEAPDWVFGASGQSADEVCHDICKSKGFCCNDYRLGSNQYISCAQACMMRHRGRTLEGVQNLCGDRTGCAETIDNFEYGFCSKCLDLTSDSICQWGVFDSSACELGAQLETCQFDLAGKVVTVYDVSRRGYLALGDVDSSGQRILQYLQDTSDPITHWRMSSAAGGWTFSSISHPLRWINAWDMRDCAQEEVSNEDSDPVDFTLESLSNATFQASSSICGAFSWTVIIETMPRSSFLCPEAMLAISAARDKSLTTGSFWPLCVGLVLFFPTML